MRTTFSVVVAGTVEAFDEENFKTRLASALPNVDASDITLNVTSASVRVQSTIASTAGTVADADAAAGLVESTIRVFTQTPALLSAALGETVEEITPPTVEAAVIIETTPVGQTTAAPPPPAADGGGATLTVPIIILVVVSLVFAALGFCALLYLCKVRRARSRGDTTTGAPTGARPKRAKTSPVIKPFKPVKAVMSPRSRPPLNPMPPEITEAIAASERMGQQGTFRQNLDGDDAGGGIAMTSAAITSSGSGTVHAPSAAQQKAYEEEAALYSSDMPDPNDYLDTATPRPEMQPTGGPQSPRMSGGKEEAEQTSVYL